MLHTPIVSVCRDILGTSARVCASLFKVMIPVLIAVKIARELGVISYLAAPLAPVMALAGLPPEMGLVWATAMVNNIYGGLVVFGGVAAAAPLTVAQATALGVMVLVAHALPVEVGIARAAGLRPLPMILLRVCGAVVLGALVFVGFRVSGLGQEPALVLWQSPRVVDPPLARWAVGELRNLGVVAVAVTLLLTLLRVLEALRVTHAMHWLLAPVFRLIGVSRKASTLTIIGLTMGISYGGGLIIGEARSGRLPDREIFFSLAFLGLCHSLFEDSLLLVLIGGSLPGLVLGRLLFAVAVVAVLVRLTAGLSEGRFARLLLQPARPPEPEG
jgi:hypothetical protein